MREGKSDQNINNVGCMIKSCLKKYGTRKQTCCCTHEVFVIGFQIDI